MSKDPSNARITPSAPSSSPMPSRFAWITRKLLPLGLFLAAAIALIVIVGIAQRMGWIRAADGPSTTTAAPTGEIFTCPMHPQIRQPGPGRCPICGMALVPAASGAADLDEFSVKIEPAQRRLANIQTAKAESGAVEATLQTVGAIAIDESRQATIAAYIDGRLERLFADYTGVPIAKGDHLAVIYSPQLYAAQVEYIEARRALNASGGLPAVRQAQEGLSANTRQRLREYGMTDEQLAELERTGNAQSRLTIYAPQGGTVVEKLAVEGNYVKAGDPIYRIADLSTVWLMLKLFPEDATRIRFGQRVEAVIQSLTRRNACWPSRLHRSDGRSENKNRGNSRGTAQRRRAAAARRLCRSANQPADRSSRRGLRRGPGRQVDQSDASADHSRRTGTMSDLRHGSRAHVAIWVRRGAGASARVTVCASLRSAAGGRQ